MVDLPETYKRHSADFICETTNPSENYVRPWINFFVLCLWYSYFDWYLGMDMRKEKKKNELHILKQLFLLLNVGLHFNQNNKQDTCTSLHDLLWEVQNLHKISSGFKLKKMGGVYSY